MSREAQDPAWDAAGFVLAGGQSSRMGTDKALVRFAGEPLVARAVRTLREAGLETRIAGARSSLEEFAPVVPDRALDEGPLGGICAAMEDLRTSLGVFLPVDLPLMPASLIACLVEDARVTGAAVTLVSLNGFAQTFPAVVDRRALPVLKAELEAGRGGCFAAFHRAAEELSQPLVIPSVERLVQCGRVAHPEGLQPVFWFWNANTPEDLARAQSLQHSRRG